MVYSNAAFVEIEESLDLFCLLHHNGGSTVTYFMVSISQIVTSEVAETFTKERSVMQRERQALLNR